MFSNEIFLLVRFSGLEILIVEVSLQTFKTIGGEVGQAHGFDPSGFNSRSGCRFVCNRLIPFGASWSRIVGDDNGRCSRDSPNNIWILFSLHR